MSIASSAIEKELDQTFADIIELPEVWMARPSISRWIEIEMSARSRRKIARLVLQYIPSYRPHPPIYVTNAKKQTFAWCTRNQRRALGSLPDQNIALKSHIPRDIAFHLNVYSYRGRRLIDLVHRRLQRTYPVPRVVVAQYLRMAMYDLLVAKVVLSQHGSQSVIVSSQYSLQSRAISLIGRSLRVPTIYVPHAPVARNRIYADLPFDYAALRGDREVDYYAGLGADARRLSVVGHLAMDIADSRTKSIGTEVIVAPSPWPRDVIEDFMKVVSAGVPGPFLVCPHPRTNLQHIAKLLPSRATLVRNRRTVDVIASRARVVVQASSGVALEAMRLGVPVVEVSNGRGESPNYPLITEPYVYFVDGPVQLESTIQLLLTTPESHDKVRERIEWATEWCRWIGSTAEGKLKDFIDVSDEAHEPLLDGWSTGAGSV